MVCILNAVNGMHLWKEPSTQTLVFLLPPSQLSLCGCVSSGCLFLLCSVSCDRERENFPIPAFPHPALICQGLVLICIICASRIRLCFRSTRPHACEVSQSKLGHGSMASALHLNPLPLPYKSLSKSKLKDNLVLILH